MSANYLELIKQVAQHLDKISEISILDLFLFGFFKNNTELSTLDLFLQKNLVFSKKYYICK